jgi:hypothetical protein
VLTNTAEETAELTSPPQRKLTATDFRKVDENCGK